MVVVDVDVDVVAGVVSRGVAAEGEEHDAVEEERLLADWQPGVDAKSDVKVRVGALPGAHLARARLPCVPNTRS